MKTAFCFGPQIELKVRDNGWYVGEHVLKI